jgi:hypothetical protein
VAHLGVQAAEALEHAHQLGVIHRDIKPANLLVDIGGRLWITDFGLAHCQSQPGLTMTGDVLGTLRYMSPEQALAKRVALDARTDVYSLGVTLYELLTLEPAYNGRTREEVLRQIAFEEPPLPSRLNHAVPAELETIVLKAMAKSAEERYATAQELAEDLERYLKDEPIRARRPTVVQRLKKWTRRHLPVVWTAGLSLVAMLVLAVIGLTASNVFIARQKAETDAANDKLERTLYFHRVALALDEWSATKLTRVEELLEAWLLNDGLVNRTDLLRLASCAPAPLQSRHRQQCLVNRHGEQLVLRRPLEHATDSVHLLRSEVLCSGMFVEPAQEAKGLADGVLLAGRLPFLDIVGFDVAPVPSEQLVDC